MGNEERAALWAGQQRLLATVHTMAHEGLRLVPGSSASPTVGQLRRYVYPAYAKLVASLTSFPCAPQGRVAK